MPDAILGRLAGELRSDAGRLAGLGAADQPALLVTMRLVRLLIALRENQAIAVQGNIRAGRAGGVRQQ